MNIEIGKGLSNIIFGMSENDIVAILGKPDRIITCREDGKEFLYNSLKIKLFFGFEEGNRLYSIEVFRKNVTFLSTEVIGMSFGALLSFMKENGYEKYKINDFEDFNTIFFDQCNTSFTIKFHEVLSFEFSPFGNSVGIIWPYQ